MIILMFSFIKETLKDEPLKIKYMITTPYVSPGIKYVAVRAFCKNILEVEIETKGLEHFDVYVCTQNGDIPLSHCEYKSLLNEEKTDLKSRELSLNVVDQVC
jgi:hypothetical protein